MHEEMVEELRRQLADRKEEARKIMDLFTYRAAGEKVFYPDPEPEAPVQIEPKDLSHLSLAERARLSLGPKASPRAIARWCEQESQRQFDKEHSTAVEMPAEMNAAIQEGRVAHKGNA